MLSIFGHIQKNVDWLRVKPFQYLIEGFYAVAGLHQVFPKNDYNHCDDSFYPHG